MGGHPFRGLFGGPPIHATINGVRHKIVLSGPTPDIKLDTVPAYDLMQLEQEQWQKQESASTIGLTKRPALLDMPQATMSSELGFFGLHTM